ncbi:MAG: hypothetical protein ABEK04_06120 [Candidatus Nanohalobium sp.]
MAANPAESSFSFPYEEEITGLIDELRDYQTRVKPENSEKIEEIDLDYGWKAILYEEDEGLKERMFQTVSHLAAYGAEYARKTPDYEWELVAPDGKKFYRRGLDADKATFEERVENFLRER